MSKSAWGCQNKIRSTETSHSSFWKPRSPRSGTGRFCSQMKALFLPVGSPQTVEREEWSLLTSLPLGQWSPQGTWAPPLLPPLNLITYQRPSSLLPKGGKPSFPYPSELLDEAFVRKHRLTREKRKFINMYTPHIQGRKMRYSPRWPEFSSVQFSRSVVSDSANPWIAARQASLSITISQSSLKLTSTESVMPSSHLIPCRPLFLLPPIPPSIRVFSNESSLCMRWPKYWSFSFSIIPSKEHPGLISFRMDWLDLLAVQGTLKSPLQHLEAEQHAAE